jgi:uncharacterized protein YjbI with pentapeptide repeats
MVGRDKEIDGKHVIKADEFLELIKLNIKNKTAIYCSWCYINGDIDIGNLDLPSKEIERSTFESKDLRLQEKVKVFGPKIDITNTVINGKLICNNVFFENAIDFSRSQIDCSCFRGAVFSRDAIFHKTKFGDATFEGSTFCKLARFEGATFYNVDFKATKFKETANFNTAQFNINNTNKSHANFLKSHFGKPANFCASTFNKLAIFRDSEFEDDVAFKAGFIEGADFRGALFKKRATFGGFNNSREKIDFKEARINDIEVPWRSAKDHIKYDSIFYQKLIRSYKFRGLFEDADDCYYTYRCEKHKNEKKKLYSKEKELDWSLIEDYIAYYTCGYGVRPIYTLLLGSALITFYAVLYWLNFVFGSSWELQDIAYSPTDSPIILNNNPFQIYYIHHNYGTNIIYESFHAIYLSSVVFLSQLPNNYYVNDFWKLIILSERICGWLIMALFIVVLARKLIR